MMNINRDDFLLKEIPTLYPKSQDYKDFWEEQRKRDIEGYWMGGYYMPPKLYFYVNFGTIKRATTANAKTKSFGRPLLRDIEWEIFYSVTEARGFSGFELDTEYSSNHVLLTPDDIIYDPYHNRYDPTIFINTFGPDGEPITKLKRYIPPRENLRKWHEYHKGAAVYANNAKNLFIMGSRDFGKDLQYDTTLYTPSGPITIEEVQVGDLIYDHTGNLTEVESKVAYTDQVQYEFKFSDKSTVNAGLGHLWTVYQNNLPITVDTKYIIENFHKYEFGVPYHSAINYPEQPIKEDLANFFDVISKPSDISETLSIADVKAEEDFVIPQRYIYASPAQKLEMIKGLNYKVYSNLKRSMSISVRLPSSNAIRRLLEILKTLGGEAKLLSVYAFNGYVRGMIELKGEVTTYLHPRARAKDHTYKVISSIRPTEVKPSYCIGVTNESKLFLVNNYTTTHNSYSVGAGIILHEWLFQGMTSTKAEKDTSVTISVVADSSMYVDELLQKAKISYDQLPGSVTIGDIKYPSPFSRKFKGSWAAGSSIIHSFKKKENGTWVDKGSKSTINGRSMRNDPFVLQGNRESLIIVEEVGHCENIKEFLKNTKDNMADGLNKIGTLIGIGTGGNMGAATQDVQEIFYKPEDFDALTFEDKWEYKGNIGLFIPASLALNDYKDRNGFTDVEKATKRILAERELPQYRNNPDNLSKFIQYRPIKPSEIFLSSTANFLPSAEIKRRIENLDDYNPMPVELFFDPSTSTGVNYRPTPDVDFIDVFPHRGTNREGSLIIWELPQAPTGKVLPGAYIIGHDPVKDDTPSGPSLACFHVLKTSAYISQIGHDELVASFLGRPYAGRDAVNEMMYKTSLFYGDAQIYYENSVGNVKEYFQKVKRLDLLARKPSMFTKKAVGEYNPYTEFGYPMSNQRVKSDLIKYLRDWLLEDRGDQKRNIDLIPSKALLQEMLAFDMDKNFDSVMAFLGCIIGLNDRKYKSSEETKITESELSLEFKRLITHNPNVFKLNPATFYPR